MRQILYTGQQLRYGVTKLDGIVEKVIRMKFAEIAAAPESEILNHQRKVKTAG